MPKSIWQQQRHLEKQKVNDHYWSDRQYYIGIFMGLLWRNVLICGNFIIFMQCT